MGATADRPPLAASHALERTRHAISDGIATRRLTCVAKSKRDTH